MSSSHNDLVEIGVPAEVEARLRLQLVDFRKRLAARKKTKATIRPAIRIALGGTAIAGAFLAAILLIPGRMSGFKLYAAAVKEFAAKRTISYTYVLYPGVEIEVLTNSSGQERKKTSWGIEMISDARKGKCLILFHKEKSYCWKEAKGTMNGIGNLDAYESLPEKADLALGTRLIDGNTAQGFRVIKKHPQADPVFINVWIDLATRSLVDVDIDFEKEGGVIGHRMEIKNIKINEPMDDALFDLTPPAGYTLDPEPLSPFDLLPRRK